MLHDMCACHTCSSEQATRKYLNSTCYFIGPLMAPAVDGNAALGRHLNATVEVTQVQDPWGSGAVLKAMQVRILLPPQILQCQWKAAGRCGRRA